MALCMSVAPNCLQCTYKRQDFMLLFGALWLALPCNQNSAGSGQLVPGKLQAAAHPSPFTSHILKMSSWILDHCTVRKPPYASSYCDQISCQLPCDWQRQSICLSKDLCPNLNHSKCGAKPYGNSPANCLQHTWVLACII